MNKLVMKRCGRVAVLGEVNAGKSTLVNRLIGHKVSIVTHKVHTTRDRVKGILSEGQSQVIFVDTPGIPFHGQISRNLFSEIWSSVLEADLIFLVLPSNKPTGKSFIRFCTEISAVSKKTPDLILIINKIDQCQKESLLLLSKELNENVPFRATFMVSALKGFGVKDLKTWILENVPLGTWLYKRSKKFDISTEQFLSEKTREVILLRVHDEIPYKLNVSTIKIEKKEKGALKIWQSINVERVRHRAMLIGKSGKTIREISIRAREQIELALGTNVHLFLQVQVDKKF